MEEFDMRKVLLAIIILIIISMVVVAVTNNVNNDSGKKYESEEIAEEDYKYFTLYTEGKYGVIDAKGNMIIENNYSNMIIPNPTKPVFFCIKEDGTRDILNEKAEKIFLEYAKVQEIPTNSTASDIPYEKSVLKYEEDGKFGLIDFSGNVVSKAVYDEISSVKYKEGEILAKKDGKYGVINNKGKELIPFEYAEIEADKYYRNGNYKESGYIVKKTTGNGYRYGYIDSEWRILLDAEYTNLSRVLEIDSNDIYLIASKKGQYGVIKNKDVKVNFAYQSVEYNKDTELYAVQRSEQYGVVNIDGQVIIPIEYKSISFNGTYILAKTYTEEIYYNKEGKKTDNIYTSMTEANDAKSYVTTNSENLYGIIDENGNKTVDNEYLYIEYAFDDFFVAYKVSEGLGLIDKNGKNYIDFKYDVLSKIGDKKLLKGEDMKNNITDIYSKDANKIASISNGNIAIHEDYIEIYNEEETHFITNSGELKTAKDVLNNNKLFASYNDEKWGFVDKEGNSKVDAEYDYVTEFNTYGFAGVKRDGKWGVIDEEGNLVLDCTYTFDDDEGMIKPEFIGKYFKTYNEENEIIYTNEVAE